MRKGLPAVLFCPNRGFYLGVAQLAERLLWEQEAVGSSPVVSTTIKRFEPASGFNRSNPQYRGI